MINNTFSKEELEQKIKHFISQPLEGLLYDLNILPEEVKENTSSWLYMLVISTLKNQREILLNALRELVEFGEYHYQDEMKMHRGLFWQAKNICEQVLDKKWESINK